MDANLYVVGDGPLRNELEEQAYIQALEKDSSVKFREANVLLSESLKGRKYGNVIFLGGKTHKEGTPQNGP